MNNTFEQFLRDLFIKQGEVDGVVITKDNIDDLFDTFLNELDPIDYLRLGTLFGKERFLKGISH